MSRRDRPAPASQGSASSEEVGLKETIVASEAMLITIVLREEKRQREREPRTAALENTRSQVNTVSPSRVVLAGGSNVARILTPELERTEETRAGAGWRAEREAEPVENNTEVEVERRKPPARAMTVPAAGGSSEVNVADRLRPSEAKEQDEKSPNTARVRSVKML